VTSRADSAAPARAVRRRVVRFMRWKSLSVGV
jgi:hypothetical protein